MKKKNPTAEVPANEIHRRGVWGNRVRFVPKKSTELLMQDDLVQEGVVTGVGWNHNIKEGDVFRFLSWGADKIKIDDEDIWYIDTSFILEVL